MPTLAPHVRNCQTLHIGVPFGKSQNSHIGVTSMSKAVSGCAPLAERLEGIWGGCGLRAQLGAGVSGMCPGVPGA